MGAGTGIGTTYTTYKERATAPSTPASTYDRLYFTSAGPYYVNSAGTAIPVKSGFAVDYAADAGSTDAYAVTLSPAPAALAAGLVVHFKANTANTGNATLNVNSLGAKNILKNHDQTLADGDIEAGQIVTVVYDGTQFQMQSQPATAAFTRIPEYVEAATDTATVDQVCGGIINNFGQANDMTLTLPAAAEGYNFTVILGTTVAKYFRLDPAAGDSIYLDGVTTGDGKYVGIASAAVGAAIQFVAFQTGAGAYDWAAYPISGAWAAEA